MLVDMIGDRLKQLRIEAGLNQPEFAAIVGTTKQFVSQLESGKNQKPNAEFLEGWARHFRVNLRWLVSGAGPKDATETTLGDHSHSVRLDPEMMAELATVLSERMKHVGGFDLRNEEHAAQFVQCYELFINMKEQPTPENMVEFSSALMTPQGATANERGKDVPAEGNAGQGVRKGARRRAGT